MDQTNAVAKKLQIKPGQKWLFYNAPENYLAALEPLPGGVEVAFFAAEHVDGIQLFAYNSKELAEGLNVVAPLLKPDTILWITYPKKSSGIKSDLEMTASWDEPAKYGLRTVAAASIDKTWTAMRLRLEGQSKTSEFCNEKLKQNEHASYIDVISRQIHLPPEMHEVLNRSLNAMEFYESLSFSNKKEYVVWILSAKQEKTKTERLEKFVKKLLLKKKNPSEK